MSAPFFDLISDKIEIIKQSLPNEIHGIRISRIEHKCDILRLAILREYGGIYLDLDTVCLRSLEDLRKETLVLGQECDDALCNAVIISPRKSQFIDIWLDGYKDFHNDQWNEFSVRLPARLASEFPNLIHIEPVSSFYTPSYSPSDLRDLFVYTREFPKAYVFHLWNKLSTEYIEKISIADIVNRDCTYNIAARPFIRELHEVKSIQLTKNRYRFEQIYRTGEWGNGSGNGSDPQYTISYRAFLEEFMSRNHIKSIVDVGCGDWQSSRYINFMNASYHGFDVVSDLIIQNNDNYSNENIRFSMMPEDASDLPVADLLILKDVLQHLSDREIIMFRDNVIPKFKFSLITNSYLAVNYKQNIDIDTGQFRSLDLTSYPYHFKGAYINEYWNQWERIRTLLILN